MPTVIPAARTGSTRPESTKGLAAAPPRKGRRESESLVMYYSLMAEAPFGRGVNDVAAVIWPSLLFVSATVRPLKDCRYPQPRHSARAPRRDQIASHDPDRAARGAR